MLDSVAATITAPCNRLEGYIYWFLFLSEVRDSLLEVASHLEQINRIDKSQMYP
jgi:hypothetical protein